MEEKKLTCICCPMGCQLQVTIRDGQGEDIPKSAVMDCIRQLKEVVVEAPVYIGDVVLTEVAGTKIAVIITKNIEKLCEKQNL